MAFADVLNETLASYSTTEGIAVPAPVPPTYPRPVGFFAGAPANVVAFSGVSFKGAATRQAVASAYGVATAQTASHAAAGTAAPASGAANISATTTARQVLESGAPSRVLATPPARVVAPRRLSPRQRRALDRLVELGAEISADFTPEQLRSAYRRLARRYHPDHHPETTEAQRQQLARLFTQARDSYSELQGAFAVAA